MKYVERGGVYGNVRIGSVSLPDEDALVEAADRDDVGVVVGELGSHNVLAVASEGLGLGAHSARVSEDVHQAVVVGGADQVSVRRQVHSVHVGAVHVLGEHSVHQPPELASLVRPDSAHRVGGATLVLLVGSGVEEEELISTANGSDVLALSAPVEAGDERVVGLQGAGQLV